MHAQQLDAVEIDLGDVSGLEAVAADLNDVVVILQIRLCQFEHGLGLKRVHERCAQRELERPFQVLVLRFGNPRAFLGALKPQLALVVALVQVAQVGDDIVPLAAATLRRAARSACRPLSQ